MFSTVSFTARPDVGNPKVGQIKAQLGEVDKVPDCIAKLLDIGDCVSHKFKSSITSSTSDLRDIASSVQSPRRTSSLTVPLCSPQSSATS